MKIRDQMDLMEIEFCFFWNVQTTPLATRAYNLKVFISFWLFAELLLFGIGSRRIIMKTVQFERNFSAGEIVNNL